MALEFKRIDIATSARAAKTGEAPESNVIEKKKTREEASNLDSPAVSATEANETSDLVTKLREKVAELEGQNELFRGTFLTLIELLEDDPDKERIAEIRDILKSVTE